MPSRLTVAALVVATVTAVVAAAAARLGVTSANLGAGARSVATCDPDGFAFRYKSDTAGRITAVTVTGIAAACAGGELRLTLTAGAVELGGGSAVLPASGFSGLAAVTISPPPASRDVTKVVSSIVAP